MTETEPLTGDVAKPNPETLRRAAEVDVSDDGLDVLRHILLYGEATVGVRPHVAIALIDALIDARSALDLGGLA